MIYIVRVLMIMIAAKRCRNNSAFNNANAKQNRTVSVVVPARNEENNIETCVESILNSNYPNDKFEIIIVNDRSTDKTSEIINKLAAQNNNIKICNIIQKTLNPNLQGKAGALQAGMNLTTGEIIMMTDADCIVPRNWIKTISNKFCSYETPNNSQLDKKTIGMVCSYTNVKGKRIFDYFQEAEWAYMHTYACAGIALNTVLGCFGNNISISRAALESIGGYDNLKFSVTEDFVLLNAVFNAGFKIKYQCNTDSAVETLPVNTFKEYMIQRKRWSIGAIDLGWKAFVYVLSSICLWVAIILSFVTGNYILLAISIIMRFLGDAFILFPVFNILELRYMKKWIPLSVCFYSFIELLLPFTLLSHNVNWKGQKFKVKKLKKNK